MNGQGHGSTRSPSRSDEHLKLPAQTPPAEGQSDAQRSRIPAETFIFVRPPPSVGNHPFNCQVQLYVPAGRVTRRMSSDAPRAETPASGIAPIANATVGGVGALSDGSVNSLARSPSTVSNRSLLSTASSNGSAAPGSGRRVAPLYNLNIHSTFMATTITDAGTDAKVAKVLKRGIEVMGFATIEAAELAADGTRIIPQLSPPTTAMPDATKTPEKPSLLSKFKRFSLQKPKILSPSASADLEPTGLGMFRGNDSEASTSAAPVSPVSRTRASGYVWSVTRFARQDLAGKEGEVTLEWRKRRSGTRSRRLSSTSDGLGRRMSVGQDVEQLATPEGGKGRRTPESQRSPQTSQPVSFDLGGESDDDSDPEESETPWSAFLILPQQRQVRLALLSPAPFHPKVVAQMQVPGNLSPIEVSNGVALNVEELKDVVACTGLWLVVRESLGGIAKVRKGDGAWKVADLKEKTRSLIPIQR